MQTDGQVSSSNEELGELHEIGLSLLIWIMVVYAMASLVAMFDVML